MNAGGGLTTSVILVVASTFDANVVRGEAPAGLRVADVSGAFQIANVPPGRYAILAAFENDQLVRDPISESAEPASFSPPWTVRARWSTSAKAAR